MPSRALRALAAPVFFFGFLALASERSAGGSAPGVLLPLLLLAVAVSFALERAIPYEASFNRDTGDTGRDVAHSLVNESANVLAVLVLPLAGAWLPEVGTWPVAWPLWAQLALAISVADLGITLAHWASHRVSLLWRFHAVHHSVERLYGLNGLMKHPLHQAFELVCGTAPLVVLGLPQNLAWLLAFAVALQLLLQHSNADLRLGPLTRIWAVAPVHRFHHVARAGEGDVNFGLFTTLGDHLLGTAHFDARRRFAPGDFGIALRPHYPKGYLAQLREPFRPGS